MKSQKVLVEYLDAQKLRDKYKVIIGGGPTSAKWGEDIGADGWAETADEAVELCKQLLG